jgi:hypothetical protein
MNERIKEFLSETKIYDGSKTQAIITCPADLEKFAELIIGHATECVRDVLRDEDSDLTYAAASQVQNRIKEFFGVEE